MRPEAIDGLSLALDVVHALGGRMSLLQLTQTFGRRWGVFRGGVLVLNLLEAGLVVERSGRVMLTELGCGLREWLPYLVLELAEEARR
jgi:hypothetical protein